jgi:hypothetical protein
MVGPLNGAMMTETLLNRKGDLYLGVIPTLARENKQARDCRCRACD